MHHDIAMRWGTTATRALYAAGPRPGPVHACIAQCGTYPSRAAPTLHLPCSVPPLFTHSLESNFCACDPLQHSGAQLRHSASRQYWYPAALLCFNGVPHPRRTHTHTVTRHPFLVHHPQARDRIGGRLHTVTMGHSLANPPPTASHPRDLSGKQQQQQQWRHLSSRISSSAPSPVLKCSNTSNSVSCTSEPSNAVPTANRQPGWQYRPGPYRVDLGGAWIHGIGSPAVPNLLYGLARRLELPCRPTDYADAVVYDMSQPYDSSSTGYRTSGISRNSVSGRCAAVLDPGAVADMEHTWVGGLGMGWAGVGAGRRGAQ